MKCANCGIELLSDAVFCMKCGAKVVQSEDQQPALSDSSESENPEPVDESGGRGSEAKHYVRSLRLFVKENQDYYLSKWRLMDNADGIASIISWNWAAFLFGVFWLGFRRMYLYTFLWLLFFSLAIYLSNLQVISDSRLRLLGLLIWVALPLVGNHVYRLHVDRKLAGIKLKYPDERTQDIASTKGGGRSGWGVLAVFGMFVALLFGIGIVENVTESTQQMTSGERTPLLEEHANGTGQTHKQNLGGGYSEAKGFMDTGDAKARLKDYKEAIADYTKAIELKPDYAEAYVMMGFARDKLDDYDGAIADFTKAIEVKPDYPAAYWFRGYSKECHKDYRGAIADFTKAIGLKPDYAEAYCTRGIARGSLQDPYRANVDFTKAIELKPDYAEAYYNRGIARGSLQDLYGAIADYTKAIDVKPDYAGAYNNRGDAKSRLDDYNGAMADYTRAIELKPDFAGAYNNRGNAKRRLDDSYGAIADYTKAIELKPDLAEAYYNRGNAKGELDDYDGAIADFTKAIEVKPDYAEAYYNRGGTRANLGDGPNACADWKKAAKLGSTAALEAYRKNCE
jgi:tetratricopeptide (TPR) repeat protein